MSEETAPPVIATNNTITAGLIMIDHPECESLPPTSRAICRGERLTVSKQNAYRALWGFGPLPDTYTSHTTEPQRTNPPTRSRGLGDTVAKFTAATGIDRVVKAVTGGGCGCAKRQEQLNEIFPYKGAQ